VNERLVEHELTISATDAARDWLGEHGYDAEFGARPLRRLIQTEVEDRLSDAVLAGRFAINDVVCIDVEDDVIVLKQEEEEVAPAT
jgi:ATP-dependent Clp protease ATP-binding subunit ClpC